jgi:hypothetical protein
MGAAQQLQAARSNATDPAAALPPAATAAGTPTMWTSRRRECCCCSHLGCGIRVVCSRHPAIGMPLSLSLLHAARCRFRRLAMKHHPDMAAASAGGAGGDSSSSEFASICEAYDVLSNGGWCGGHQGCTSGAWLYVGAPAIATHPTCADAATSHSCCASSCMRAQPRPRASMTCLALRP